MGVTAVDIRVLNTRKWGRQLGPMRKSLLIQAMNAPIYVYYYYTLTQGYSNFQRHLVQKYLIEGDEILYRKRK